jgi:inner membrane protein
VASALTHAFAAVALTKTLSCRKHDCRFWTLAVISSILPDADVVGFLIGINYGDLLGHRGLSHSLSFAAFWSLLVMSGEHRRLMKFPRHWCSRVGLIFLATISHGILDAMTDGGLGVAFFSPFDTTRYFFAWRPIRVSPIGVGQLFTGRGAAIMASEIEYVWLPLAAVWAGVGLWRRRFSSKSGAGIESPNSHDGQPKR